MLNEIALNHSQPQNHSAKIRKLKYLRNENALKGYNKFEIEFIKTTKKNNDKIGSIEDIFYQFEVHKMSKDRFILFRDYIFLNEYDSDSVAMDFDDASNGFNESNLFSLIDGNKFYAKIIKNTFKLMGNDNDKLPIFELGEKDWPLFLACNIL